MYLSCEVWRWGGKCVQVSRLFAAVTTDGTGLEPAGPFHYPVEAGQWSPLGVPLEIAFRARKLTLVPSWAALRPTLSYGHTCDKQTREPVCLTLFRADGWALFQDRDRDGPSFLRPASGINGCVHL